MASGGIGEHGAATIRPLLVGDAISDIVAIMGIILRCGARRIIRLSDPVNPALIVVTHIVPRCTRAIKGLHLGAHNPAQFVQIAGCGRADGGTRGYFNNGGYIDTIHRHRGTRYRGRGTGIIGRADDDIIRRGAADLTAKRIIAHRGDAAIGIGQLFDQAKARVIGQRVTMIQGIVQGSGITAVAEVAGLIRATGHMDTCPAERRISVRLPVKLMCFPVNLSSKEEQGTTDP